MKFKRLIYGSLLSLSLFTTASLFSVVAATNGIQKVYTGKECLAAEFDKVTGATSYTAYIKGENDNSYQPIDSQLVRVTSDKVRVDAVGLKAGTYSLKFESNNSNSYIELTDITVEADDRSGYAHHNYTSGVGAYDDYGTLKSGAKVIYVIDATKNNIDEDGDGVGDGHNLAYYFANASASQPLDVRIIGAVKTVQWNEKTYLSEKKTTALVTEQTNSLSGATKDENKKRIYAENIPSTINSYSDDISNGITALEDLTSYISYSTKNNSISKYDTYWNMMEVKEKSNITIEGIGEDASIFQWGFTFHKCNSIEVKNIEFNNYTEDAIGIQGNGNTDNDYKNFWIHNCTFNQGNNNWDLSYEKDKGDGDGSTDFKYAHNLTISYCAYNQTHKSNLIGSSNDALQYNITLHHNFYNTCTLRLPLVRQANIHMYNNYYLNTVSHGISVRAKAFAFIENNYFAGKNPFMLAYEVKDDGVDPVGTTIKAINNEFASGIATGDSSDNGIALKVNGIYVLTASGTNKTYSTNTSATRTTQSVGSVCTPDGTTDYTNFDTDSTKFYYENGVSKVTVMDDAADLPDLIPTVTGVGKLNEYTTYSVTGEEEVVPSPVYDNTSVATYLDEDFSGDVVVNTATSSSTPTTPGIYQYTNLSPVSYTNNYVEKDSNGLYIYDNSEKTTIAYYMFSNTVNSGKVVYTVNIKTGEKNGSKWNVVQFIGESSSVTARSCGLIDDAKNKWGYSTDGGTTEHASDLDVAADTNYEIILTVDYTNNTTILSINDTEMTIEGWTQNKITGLKFVTADKATDRSFHVNSISIEKVANLKLGYQLGSYTKNNTKYNALRIIGKIEYDDIYKDLDSIDSVTIDVIVEDANGNQTKSVSQEITNIYKSLKISNGDTITDVGPKLRYYYTVVRGITSSYSGYKIKATSTINLKNGVKVECSGFTYEIQ